MAKQQKRTPAYGSYQTLKNNIIGLDHVPDVLDYSVFPTMSGATRGLFFSALKFFNLIDDQGTPTVGLHSLVDGTDEERQLILRQLIESNYQPQLEVLKNGTMVSLKKSFGDDIGASVLAPACRFLINAAKDTGLPVSSTIAKTKVGSNGATTPRKKKTRRGSPRDGASVDTPTPKGMITFAIHFPSKPEGMIRVPKDLTADDLPLVQTMMAAVEAYAERQKGGAS